MTLTLAEFLGQMEDMFAGAAGQDMVIPPDLAAMFRAGFGEAREAALILQAYALVPPGISTTVNDLPDAPPPPSNVVAFPVAPRITCFNREGRPA